MLLKSIILGVRSLLSRRIYVACMIVIPLACLGFFLSLMGEGLPLRVPVAVVDLDNSQLSRQVTRNLDASELTDVRYRVDSYAEAMAMTRRGDIYGFFIIPADFQKEAIGGRGPTLTFYSNLTFFVPGTLSYKGFKTTSVTTSGGIVQTTLVAHGVSDAQASELLQPVVVQEHPLGNPWTNYSVYLSVSFIPGVLALMILLVTTFSICDEIKRGTSRLWLGTAGDSMVVALFGKLLPQTVVFSIVGIAIQSTLFGWQHFPLNCSPWVMISAMVIMVISTQALGVMIACAIPNLRMGVSIASLLGILSFSLTGFSFPVQNMYGSVAIFSYIIPLRYYFLIYCDQALMGFGLFYSRWWYIAMLLFPLLSFIGLPRLRRRCLNPVYVP